MTPAETWHAALRRADTLDPDRISRAILERTDTGLRATTYDRDGGRTTHAPCVDEWCPDGPDPHSHPVTADPTGNAAMHGVPAYNFAGELRRLDIASRAFVEHAGEVLDWVVGKRPTTWADVLKVNARLMPGTVQAGLDVDDDYRLPPAIARVDRAVAVVHGLAKAYVGREPTDTERHWTSGLADDECCAWHLLVEPRYRYRRPRAEGKNICSDCVALVLLADGARPPLWLLEAEVERGVAPRAWTASLARWLDELGLARSA